MKTKATTRKLSVTGTVEHNIYIADFKFTYNAGTFETERLKETELTTIWRLEEVDNVKIDESELSRTDRYYLLEKAEQLGLELICE